MSTVTQDSIYPFIVTDSREGHPDGDFDTQSTEIKIRRIPAAVGNPERLQIEISIVERRGRAYSMHSSLTLTPDQVKQLIRALKSKVRP